MNKRLLIIAFVFFLVSCEQNITRNTVETVDKKRIEKLAANYAHGKQLFTTHCGTCHHLTRTDDYFFHNLFSRLPEPAEEYFTQYVRNSKKVKESGNQYALKIDTFWENSYEHAFEKELNNEDFSDLILYLKVLTKQ